MARFSGPAEMEMEMEMEMDAGPSIPFPMGSPVRRPIGVSPTVPAEDGEFYRGNKWPPVPGSEMEHNLIVEANGADREPLPGRQWTSNFFPIAVLAEFVQASINSVKLDDREKNLFQDLSPEDKEEQQKYARWNNVKLREIPDLDRVKDEIRQLVTLIEYRPGVLSEALAQANGIDDYFRGVLSFSASSHPRTFGLMQIALRVGEFQCMHYKYKFDRIRPSRLCPWLMPPIEVPGHASYPSGHSTQSHLVALILSQVLPRGRVEPVTAPRQADRPKPRGAGPSLSIR